MKPRSQNRKADPWRMVTLNIHGDKAMAVTRGTTNNKGQIACRFGGKFGPSVWVEPEYINRIAMRETRDDFDAALRA